ncbi:cation-translocating P-type ATPase [Raoultibacter phocaeensis]|uniref:cation-translocating P-type ATPase n=1 Tax=Raoultibacter phocaeensis TaxID=2479841 RepID=UPI001119C5CB|nr:cation-translocating P-type ATPase [Raoultibacter phocaeensis]
MTAQPYRLTADEVIEEQQSSPEGLTPEEAKERLARFGENELYESEGKSAIAVFFGQFKDLLVIILIVAAVISLLSGHLESTIVIFVVIVLNAVLGTVQTIKAEQSLASLKEMSAPAARVVRSGERALVPAAEVVPGDVLELEAGDLVAADARIVESFSLKVNESALTGESESVEKIADALDGADIPIGDRDNMVFSGSLVTYGRARAVVTATGMATEIGRIASLMNETSARKTPLQKSLDDFSAKLAIGIFIICGIVFALSIFRSGMSVIDSLMFAVALAVAAIPEALGSIVTIILAIGTQKMAKQHAIIKDLKAVESLGSVSVICSDKTGTLTQNRMSVQGIYVEDRYVAFADIDLDDAVERRLVEIGLLASDATTDEATGAAIGDPTEVALVRIGDNLAIDEGAFRASHPRLGELAFDSDRKLMSTLHQRSSGPTLLTKGALDVLLDRSVNVLTADGVVPLTEERKAAILDENRRLSENGLRVLAFAERTLDAVREPALEDEFGYTFVGLAAMMDPPRPEAVRAVADARKAGIRTVMITGDHKVTASAIARELGILGPDDRALDGAELDAMSDEELDRELAHISVYARVSPEHKIRIVSAWQRRGSIVAMTGDGVNDAPALKQADIGVAMGITGTEVSKDAASMILSDDNFATIVRAVENGRGVYANIKGTVHFLLSGNAAGILSVLFASLAALPAPFAPVQLLFINLLTDSLPAVSIGMEPVADDVLAHKPRDPKEPILDKRLLAQIGIEGVLITIPTMAAFFIGLDAGGAALAMTMAFATLSLARLFHGFNCRGNASIFHLGLLSNPYTLGAFVLGVVLLAAVLFIPALHPFVQVVEITAGQAGLIAALAFAPTAVIQLYRVVRGLVTRKEDSHEAQR